MTITNTTVEKRHSGADTTGPFSFPFQIQNETDVTLYKITDSTNAAVLLALTTDYTVSINTTSEGGNITTVENVATGETLVIIHTPAYTQATDIPTNNSFTEVQVENEFDKRGIIDLRLDYLIDQAIRLQKTTALSVSASAVATDLSFGTVFDVDADDDFTLSNPSNPPLTGHAQLITWRIKQDATGSRLITLDTKFRVASDIGTVTLSTAANTIDYLEAMYNHDSDDYDVIRFVKGIS